MHHLRKKFLREMPYTAKIYQVIIVSPGDVTVERQLARDIVLEWNDVNSTIVRLFETGSQGRFPAYFQLLFRYVLFGGYLFRNFILAIKSYTLQ